MLYFHSSRSENLRQTLRFLFEREKVEKEVILVCNDKTNENFSGCRLINLDQRDYRKAVMCNIGVAESKGDLVALMDSDRILPRGYFTNYASSFRRGDFMSCRRMLRVSNPASDQQIEDCDFQFEEEFRSEGWCLWRRNLFSGNTLFYRSDYLESGGMDESFVGYGFADNDMTRTVLSMGFRARWEEETEIHLHHPKEAMEGGAMIGIEKRMHSAHKNMCRFLKKWKMKEFLRHCKCIS